VPKVSVIMPAYNAERYIRAAIESVLAQTYSDWELIVVDDGSTDKTADIVSSFRDPRILFVSQPNRGEGAARNVGLANVSGEYVAFLDADDLYLPNALASNARCLDIAPEIVVVYADGYYCDDGGEPFARLSDFRKANITGRVLDTLVISPLLNASCCAMVRSACIRQYGLRFDPDLVIATDWKFFIQVAARGPFGYNPETICKYRIHGSNISISQSPKRRLSLTKIRMSILASDYFADLSPESQFTLFYQLLFEGFPDDPDQQNSLLGTQVFKSLNPAIQAKVLRLLASHWLLKGKNYERIATWLERAIQMNPRDRRAYFLSMAHGAFPPLCRLVLQIRRQIGSWAQHRQATSPFDHIRIKDAQ